VRYNPVLKAFYEHLPAGGWQGGEGGPDRLYAQVVDDPECYGQTPDTVATPREGDRLKMEPLDN
jgi:hypothetical protein